MSNQILNPLLKLWEKYGYKIFLFIGVLGVVIISLSEYGYNTGELPEENYSAEDYRVTLENSLTELISQIEGAGKVKLMITLESGEENIYAIQEKTDNDSQYVSANNSEQTQHRNSCENEIVMTEETGAKYPVVEKTLRPVVQGVVVVCQGAGDITVVSNITNAVSVVLNIPSNRVCVIKMQ